MVQIIFYIFIISTIIQFIYWIFIFSKLAFYRIPTDNLQKEQEPVSIIICAHNEAENLEKNLPRILNQNYRSYEVIVVNDNSTDNTHSIVFKYMKKYSNLRLVNSKPKKVGEVGKKFPLREGIESSKYQTLLLTDADCCPSSVDWLALMQNRLSDKVEIALGYSPYYETQSNILNRFIRFEAIYTAIQYLSFALVGEPYMGVGRNLAYRKHLFFKVGGFDKHKHIASGDDDLFINEVANKENVGIVLDEKAFVYSEPKTDWKNYFRQKTRHLSTAGSYQLRHKTLLGLLSFSHFFHYAGGLILIILKFSIIFVGMVFVLRMSVVIFYYARLLNKLQDHSLLKWIPFLDLMYILYYVVFAPFLIIGKTVTWK